MALRKLLAPATQALAQRSVLRVRGAKVCVALVFGLGVGQLRVCRPRHALGQRVCEVVLLNVCGSGLLVLRLQIAQQAVGGSAGGVSALQRGVGRLQGLGGLAVGQALQIGRCGL